MKATTRLRQLLDAPGIVAAPGAYDCLSAAIIEREGFPAVYMTGAGTSIARVGYPDLALATMSEMVANAAAIARPAHFLRPDVSIAAISLAGPPACEPRCRGYDAAHVAARLISPPASLCEVPTLKRSGRAGELKIWAGSIIMKLLHTMTQYSQSSN